MNEAEKRFREWLDTYETKGYVTGSAWQHLVELFDAALSSARDASLEEAIRLAEREGTGNARGWLVARMRALKSRPAERYIPAMTVGAVLSALLVQDHGEPVTITRMVHEVARRLGVDLGATPACTCGAPDPSRPSTLQAAHYGDCPSTTPAKEPECDWCLGSLEACPVCHR